MRVNHIFRCHQLKRHPYLLIYIFTVGQFDRSVDGALSMLRPAALRRVLIAVCFVAVCYNDRILIEWGYPMAKASSPMRLEESLVQAARAAGSIEHRSAAEQIEFWADVGKRLSNHLSAMELMELKLGFAKLKVEPLADPAVNPDDLFAHVEAERCAGTLNQRITTSSVRYQASSRYPGKLERIGPDGEVAVGMFHNGVFEQDAALAVG